MRVPHFVRRATLRVLIGGAIAALAMEWLGERRRGDLLPVLACVAVGAVSVVGALSVASG